MPFWRQYVFSGVPSYDEYTLSSSLLIKDVIKGNPMIKWAFETAHSIAVILNRNLLVKSNLRELQVSIYKKEMLSAWAVRQGLALSYWRPKKCTSPGKQ